MPLSWNEINGRAIAFAKKWDGESSAAIEYIFSLYEALSAPLLKVEKKKRTKKKED